MKLMTGILAVAMMTGAAWGQNPDAIDNARSVARSLQQIKTNETNAALAASGVPASPQAGKAATESPAKSATGQSVAAKPAGSKPAAVSAAKGTPAPATKAGKPHDAFLPKQRR